MTERRKIKLGRVVARSKRSFYVSQLGGARNINMLSERFSVENVLVNALNTYESERSYMSWTDGVRCKPSLLRYSVFRSHGTWAGRGVDTPEPDAGAAPFAYGAEFVDGSPRRKRSFGSSGGRFSGSGFSAKDGMSAVACARGCYTDQNHRHHHPTSTPSIQGPTAFHIPHLRSWATVYRLQARSESLGVHSATGL